MIIVNKHFPPKGFSAITIFPFVYLFRRDVYRRLSPGQKEVIIKHEDRHSYQMLELGIIGFYLLYLIFTLYYGYRNNPFERAAHEKYKPYLWVKYLG